MSGRRFPLGRSLAEAYLAPATHPGALLRLSLGWMLLVFLPAALAALFLGMPAEVKVDLTGLWHRETELKGAYTYGTERLPDGTTARTFDLALDTANHYGAERLLSATYRLDEHVDAIAHAAAAGRRGAIKIAFDLR